MNALTQAIQPTPVARFCGRAQNSMAVQLYFHLAEPYTLEHFDGSFTSYGFFAVSIADLRKFGVQRVEALLIPSERHDRITRFEDVAEYSIEGHIALPHGEDGEQEMARQLLLLAGYKADFTFFDVQHALARDRNVSVRDAIEI